jgi:O6-methylguanine-DNA--protein-cysteine methyltransferase
MVKALETNLEELLAGQKQYQVPLYQRTYSWKKAQLAQLWDDVVQLAEDRVAHTDATHFMGSLVLAPSPGNGPAGIQNYLVVDGQQRLTTLTLLLAAIRDHRAETESPEHRDRINEVYLLIKWGQGQPLKLVPTQADRPGYEACVKSYANADSADPIGSAYAYFRAKLLRLDDPDDALDIERLESAVVRGLALVAVTAEDGDNVHRIFESLNNTGLRLTQADLLRNYLFMRLPTRGEHVYQAIWLPLQERLTSEELELLFWIDLVSQDATAKQTDTYSLQQRRFEKLQTEEEVEAEVARLAKVGALLKLVLDPEQELDPAVRLRLRRLKEWDTSTAIPVQVALLGQREGGQATSSQVADALLCLESFFVRRIVAGRATKGDNRVLLRAVGALRDDEDVAYSLRKYLSTGRKFWATNDEVRLATRSVPFYWQGRARQKKLILQWLDESFASKEQIDLSNCTIEHVAPQTMTDAWEEAYAIELGSATEVKAKYAETIHLIGNLTLTPYNPELSNYDFATKREQYRVSGLRLNQQIAERDAWGPDEILARCDDLAELIVSLWPGPLDSEALEGDDSPLWVALAQALLVVPAGAWVTYGDLAAIIGTHAVPLGQRLATQPVQNAHRVLRSDGTISPGFRWTDPERTDDPLDILVDEGIKFDELGHASPQQRLTIEDLAQLLGLEGSEIPGALPDPVDDESNSDREERFLQQLSEKTTPTISHGVLQLMADWVAAGGVLQFGRSSETSCFLMARTSSHPSGSIWPVAIYPSGKVEVVFQYQGARPPFDDVTLRHEFRERLNRAAGVDLPAAKIDLRPGFPLSVVAQPDERRKVSDALKWFLTQCQTS